MQTIRTLSLLLSSALLLAGCSQAPTVSQEELQARVTAAEARAKVAEKRAKDAEILADQHRQEPVSEGPPAAPPEIADGGGDFGKPMNDTAPIDPVPVSPPQH